MNFTVYFINRLSPINDALKAMDVLRTKLLIVVDENELFCGLLSIGDIQRSILSETALTTEIIEILRSDYIFSQPDDSLEAIRQIMLSIRAEFMPIVNKNREIVNVIFWKDIFENDDSIPLEQFDLPIIIMAGGFGSRVKPLTNVFPKPLLPIGDKTMLEEIFSRFSRHGSNSFYISVNYKANLIEYYLLQQGLPYSIDFFREEKPLGTAGSLHLLKDKLHSTFFVSNCDILIEQDYASILEYHRENNNEITIVSALKNLELPYGTLTTGVNGSLEALSEKPTLSFQINSGMYILEPSVLKDIPKNELYHITHLIEKLISEKRKIGVFPVSERSWVDMGTLTDYIRLIT